MRLLVKGNDNKLPWSFFLEHLKTTLISNQRKTISNTRILFFIFKSFQTGLRVRFSFSKYFSLSMYIRSEIVNTRFFIRSHQKPFNIFAYIALFSYFCIYARTLHFAYYSLGYTGHNSTSQHPPRNKKHSHYNTRRIRKHISKI